MTQSNIEILIESLKADYVTYRGICSFKLKTLKDPLHEQHKKCIPCNGYSSTLECEDFIDLPHLIEFYEEFRYKKLK